MASFRFALSRALATRSAMVPRAVASSVRPALASAHKPAFVHCIRAYTDEAAPPSNDAPRPPPVEFGDSTMFISNVSFQLSEADLIEEIGKLGKITQFRPLQKRPGSFHITFEDAATMESVVQKVNGSFWRGRMIRAAVHKPRTNAPSSTLFFNRVPLDATDAELGEAFGDLEGTARLRIASDRETGKLRGFGHVDFETVEEAQKAREMLMGRKIRDQTIYFDYSTSKTDASRGPKKQALRHTLRDMDNWSGDAGAEGGETTGGERKSDF